MAASKAGEENIQQYVLLPLWSSSSKDPQNIYAAPSKVKEPESAVHVSPTSCDKPQKHDDKPKREAKGKSPVELSTRVRDLRDEFEEFSDNSTNEVNAASIPVTTVGPNSTNITNTFSAAGPSNNVVYKVVKALYGLHQAPRAWHETLANYLLENDLCKAFEKLMKYKFQMSSMGEITFFLGLQVKHKQDGIFISQDKYVVEILRKFGLTDGKSASLPIDTEKPLLKDHDGEDVDVYTYRSMIASLMYLTLSKPDIMFAVCACARF
nr:hypothetical protein [Tanacetum cinerariifolium]